MDITTNNIKESFPFISVLNYGDDEYVGIIINQDAHVISFYDLSVLKSDAERGALLQLGEVWWWESNRQLPINIFLRREIEAFKYCIKTFSSKDVVVVLGHVVSLNKLTTARIKRKSVRLVRRVSD